MFGIESKSGGDRGLRIPLLQKSNDNSGDDVCAFDRIILEFAYHCCRELPLHRKNGPKVFFVVFRALLPRTNESHDENNVSLFDV